MIQRIQTIYLALATIFTAIFAFTTIATIANIDSIYQLSSFGLFDSNHKEALAIINTGWFGFTCAVFVALQFGIIFLYNNRVLQMRVSTIAALINVGLIGMVYFTVTAAATKLNGVVSYNIVAVFPLIAAILLVLAIKGIKKDENLIKSLNRIR